MGAVEITGIRARKFIAGGAVDIGIKGKRASKHAATLRSDRRLNAGCSGEYWLPHAQDTDDQQAHQETPFSMGMGLPSRGKSVRDVAHNYFALVSPTTMLTFHCSGNTIEGVGINSEIRL